jgi:hypothetical protein
MIGDSDPAALRRDLDHIGRCAKDPAQCRNVSEYQAAILYSALTEI